MSNAVLTPREARFVQEYLVDACGTQAAIRAGAAPLVPMYGPAER